MLSRHSASASESSQLLSLPWEETDEDRVERAEESWVGVSAGWEMIEGVLSEREETEAEGV